MMLRRILALSLLFASLQMVSAQTLPDTEWLYKGFNSPLTQDSIPPDYQFYYTLGLCDTSVGQFLCFTAADTTDTGNTYHGQYINFNYQFEHNTSNPVDSAYYNNGFAGFKLFWDGGMHQWDASEYGAFHLAHKGPLPGHKVQLVWGWSSGCGTPINYEVVGSFKSSTTWVEENIPFPAGFNKIGIFELRFLVYDDSTTTTSQTSGPGDLKIDEIAFVNHQGAGVLRNGKTAAAAAIDKRVFVPAVSGKVTLAIYSLQGERLFKGLVDVSAGKTYSVNQFALSNSSLPASVVRCVQITGAGMNITRTLW